MVMEEKSIRCGGVTFDLGPPMEEDWPWIVKGLEVSYLKDTPEQMIDDERIHDRIREDVQNLRGNMFFDNDLIVARDSDGKRAAYLWIMVVPMQYTGERRGWMFQLYVSEDHRSLGLGKALMELGERWTLSLGMRSIAVMVGARNREGVGILEAMGFEVEGYNMGKMLKTRDE
jgi:GNAT superfamily N-acetyltransferase